MGFPTTEQSPVQNKKPLLHGVDELPRAEREFYEQQLYFRPEVQQTNRYVRVTGTNHLANGFRESVAREIETNPQLADILRRVERNAERYAKGFQTKERFAT